MLVTNIFHFPHHVFEGLLLRVERGQSRNISVQSFQNLTSGFGFLKLLPIIKTSDSMVLLFRTGPAMKRSNSRAFVKKIRISYQKRVFLQNFWTVFPTIITSPSFFTFLMRQQCLHSTLLSPGGIFWPFNSSNIFMAWLLTSFCSPSRSFQISWLCSFKTI